MGLKAICNSHFICMGNGAAIVNIIALQIFQRVIMKMFYIKQQFGSIAFRYKDGGE